MVFMAVSIDSRYHGERGDIRDYMDALVRAWRADAADPDRAYVRACVRAI